MGDKGIIATTPLQIRLFGLAAMVGFLGFSGWLVLVGAGLLRRPAG